MGSLVYRVYPSCPSPHTTVHTDPGMLAAIRKSSKDDIPFHSPHFSAPSPQLYSALYTHSNFISLSLFLIAQSLENLFGILTLKMRNFFYYVDASVLKSSKFCKKKNSIKDVILVIRIKL